MQHAIQMTRLARLAERNRNSGLKVLFTTATIVGSTLAAFIVFTFLTTGL